MDSADEVEFGFLAEENNMFSVEKNIDPDSNFFQSHYVEQNFYVTPQKLHQVTKISPINNCHSCMSIAKAYKYNP